MGNNDAGICSELRQRLIKPTSLQSRPCPLIGLSIELEFRARASGPGSSDPSMLATD
jgi:hypothetical protein